MISFLSRSQRGWVSLPIIVLLLAVSTLSMRYQDAVLSAYQWRGQLNDVEEELKIWQDFSAELVASPSFHLATLSDCVGFCDLTQQQFEEKEWSDNSQTLHYQWSRYEVNEEGLGDIETSYRLCATQNQQAYLCWWWRDGKLISSGWLSVN